MSIMGYHKAIATDGLRAERGINEGNPSICVYESPSVASIQCIATGSRLIKAIPVISIMTETRNKEKTLDASSQHSVKDVEAELNLGSQAPVLAKSFNLLSACATGMTTGNAWAVLGGGIVRAHSSRWTDCQAKKHV